MGKEMKFKEGLRVKYKGLVGKIDYLNKKENVVSVEFIINEKPHCGIFDFNGEIKPHGKLLENDKLEEIR